MNVTLGAEELSHRRNAAAGSLAPLAGSLHRDLEPLLSATEIRLPGEKARLTRVGGRCPTHGVLLTFDPFSPRQHRCPVCGESYRDEAHYRWWVMNYQLWLAERAVHGAVLFATTGNTECRRITEAILTACAEAYLGYPNEDNVLGPTRPFFSTYLESIWTLQLAIALDVLETLDPETALGTRVRERLIEPSVALISEYDEGASNRQVWNNAALIAGGALLGADATVARAVDGRSGLLAHLRGGLLADGSWYEGENYHQFAHRGLWYGVTLAERRGVALPDELQHRFHEAFALPFATALPDLTLPARRDSQYAVSLRQWRYAESCELGLARRDDERLRGALAELYRADVPEGDTERSRSTAEAERNAPAARLTRASLGWKSLLHAQPSLEGLEPLPPRSVHLPQQGFAVFRRQNGKVYAAIDYGTPGGGHGHPDRLNLWLVAGPARFLEDVGTGSYVERALFWYRSTLAHNAPLANGVSQPYGAGTLRAYDEQNESGWIEAEFEIIPGRARVRRRLVVMQDYLLDELSWTSADDITIDLPMHVDPEVSSLPQWTRVDGSDHRSGSGFEFLRDVERAAGAELDELRASRNGESVRAWVATDVTHEWFRAVAPGPPGGGLARFVFVRARGKQGRIRSVWAWAHGVTSSAFGRESTTVHFASGETHIHEEADGGWSILASSGRDRQVVALGGRLSREDAPPAMDAAVGPPNHVLAAGRPFGMELGERHYRRSELPWRQAGAPEATLRVAAGRAAVDIEIHVRKSDPVFAPRRAANPLDNEDPDINSDGVQLYLYLPDSQAYASWLLVPEAPSGVRVTPRAAGGPVPPLTADWRLTSDGYRVRCSFSRGAQGLGIDRHFMLNVVINEISRGRERRRGQLVATGTQDEWVYLRGDREDPHRMLAFEIVDG
ncbi:MAG: heparinase II/III domain-containing protein [Gemmatimonadaceae bacterium]